jgi:mono/diheme cytochrome c family protein
MIRVARSARILARCTTRIRARCSTGILACVAFACIAFLPSAQAQDGAAERGAQLYRQNCAVPYCHGPDGTAGRAPRLIGHNYSLNGMFKVISWGIPGTGMPEFTSRLKTREIDDLVAFLMTLRGTPAAPPTAPAVPPRALTADAKAGRALFFDATRTGACGTCHELDGWGVPVGPDLSVLPAERFADLREVMARRVVTVRPKSAEAPFPALVLERTEAQVRVYDLTGPLPVLRTFAASQVALDAASSWRHEQATRIYANGELETIARYLRWRNGK